MELLISLMPLNLMLDVCYHNLKGLIHVTYQKPLRSKFKWMNCVVCELYVNKAILNMQTKQTFSKNKKLKAPIKLGLWANL